MQADGWAANNLLALSGVVFSAFISGECSTCVCSEMEDPILGDFLCQKFLMVDTVFVKGL